MTLADVLQFLHVVSAFMLVTGIAGRDIVLGGARRTGDVEKVRDLVETAGPFERFLVIPGSFLVLLFGILTWWAQDIPFWDEGTRWDTVSLIVFFANIPLIPLIFIPRGKIFEAALASAVSSGTDLVRALRGTSRPARRRGTLVGGRNDHRHPAVDGDETVPTPMDGSIRSDRSTETSISAISNERYADGESENRHRITLNTSPRP